MMVRGGPMGMVVLVCALLAWPLLATGAAEPSKGKALAAKKAAPVPRRGRSQGADRSVRAAVPPAAADKAASSVNLQEPAATTAGASKPRVYTFGGLEVEGKLKAPQLLYFRSRMRQELDTSSSETRSFLKELEKSADEKGL